MLYLCLSFILASYILKIFFPNEFILCVENENIVKIGAFIDDHKLIYFMVMLLTGLLSDYLYFCAVCKKWKLNYSLLIIMSIYNIILASLYSFEPQIISNYSSFIVACSICYMVLIPIFYTKDIKPLAITFCVYYFAQSLCLGIRDLPSLLTNVNTLTTQLMCMDGYVWSLVCCLIFNYKKKGE